MNRAMTDADAPDLCVRQSGQEPVRGGQPVFGHLVLAGIDVDGDDVAIVAGFDLGANLPLVNFLAKPGMFFLAVSWLADHGRVTPLRRGGRKPLLVIGPYYGNHTLPLAVVPILLRLPMSTSRFGDAISREVRG